MAESPSASVPFQYATAEQRHAADRLGMWIFLTTELLLFGSLFTAYATYRIFYPTVFQETSRQLNLSLGAINTGILLLSSLAVALAVRSVRIRARRPAVLLLAVAICLGLVFLVLKFVEYAQHYRNHLAPGFGFAYPGADPQHAEMFFVLYFVMTGVHALHVTIGLVLLTTMLVLVSRRPLLQSTEMPLDLSGLYWHFVDVIWVFLYPLLYLVGRH